MSVPYAEVIGDPVAHSKSPLIHGFWLAKLGLDYDYVRTRVTAAELPDFLDRRRGDPLWCGCSVTIPHKQAVLESLDEASPTARTIGAANCITRVGRAEPRLAGDNTDWLAFLEPLRPWLEVEHKMRLAHVIGSGGAAMAISYALDRAGFTIVSVGRDWRKALALRTHLSLFDDDLAVELGGFAGPGEVDWGPREDVLDLLVNATPLGMIGYPPLPLDLDLMPPGLIVYDLVYEPLETPLLREARERALRTVGGIDMLIAQAAAAFRLFFAETAPREHDEELRERLTR
jgi:shikimate dehydrogenase